MGRQTITLRVMVVAKSSVQPYHVKLWWSRHDTCVFGITESELACLQFCINIKKSYFFRQIGHSWYLFLYGPNEDDRNIIVGPISLISPSILKFSTFCIHNIILQKIFISDIFICLRSEKSISKGFSVNLFKFN